MRQGEGRRGNTFPSGKVVMSQSGCEAVEAVSEWLASIQASNPVHGVRLCKERSTCPAWGAFDLATGKTERTTTLGVRGKPDGE
jgi:hypothetical protein